MATLKWTRTKEGDQMIYTGTNDAGVKVATIIQGCFMRNFCRWTIYMRGPHAAFGAMNLTEAKKIIDSKLDIISTL